VRVVFDTVIFVRCLLNPHSLWGELIFRHAGEYTLVISEPVVREILEVLHRPELTRKFRTVENMDTARVLDILAEAQAVEVTNIEPVSRDPKDDKFIAAAQAAGAAYLVSEDRDLLDFGEHAGIPIIDGMTFLRILEASDS
jgi:uncharacterized protein